uniref:Protein Mis18-alpha n=1 Tax=Sparus aurata TaxID=8175 RepID=A0A671W3Z9_SPAAU
MHIGLVDLELAWLATQYVAIFQPPSINIAGYRLISKCGFKYPLHLLLKKESFIKATREIQKASLPPLTHETGSTRALNLASSRFRSSLPRKTQKHRQKIENSTFETSSLNSTVVDGKLFDREVEDEDEDEDVDDGPVVFICGKCKMPVGDSMSWDGGEDGENQIRLKRVTHNVLIGKENRLYELNKRSVCLVVDLVCRGCHTVLGMVYTSTPKNLDHRRFTFCLNVEDIDSYVLGSASQMLAAEGPKELPVTLEYRGIVEQELMEVIYCCCCSLSVFSDIVLL